jgi:hypothetical protein
MHFKIFFKNKKINTSFVPKYKNPFKKITEIKKVG